MIWGVEGRWLWIPPPYADDQTPANFAAGQDAGPYPLVMARRDSLGKRAFPRIKLEKIGGLRSTGDSADKRDNAVGREGEIVRRAFRRGKTVTFEGIIQCTSLNELHQWEDSVTAAFSDQSAEGLAISQPPRGGGEGYSYFWARSIACEIDDEFAFSGNRAFTFGFERRFVAAVRCARAGGVFYRDQQGVAYP